MGAKEAAKGYSGPDPRQVVVELERMFGPTAVAILRDALATMPAGQNLASTRANVPNGANQVIEERVRAVAQPLRNEIQALKGQVQPLQEQLKEYAEIMAKLKAQPCPYACVVAIRGEKVEINYAGKRVEVEKPAKFVLSPGKTVKIVGDTLAIIDVVDDDAPTGEVVVVTRVPNDKLCEVERAGSTRALAYSGALEEGDRVVVDSSGSVVLANLGKDPNDCSVAEATGVCWDDIGGLAEAKRQMREAVEAPVRDAERFARYGRKPIKGVLLYGPPGNGKTMLGKAAATALAELHGKVGGGYFYVKGPELLNMYVGNTEASIRRLFENARRHKKKAGHPAIVFIDEADSILGKRSGMGLTLSSTIVPAFLAEMDGLTESAALVLLATNRPDVLDPAVVRDGRIDRRIRVGRPSREDALEIAGKHLERLPLAVGAGEDAASVLVDALFDPGLVLYRVRKQSSVGKGSAFTLGHAVSGAMLAGVVQRAASMACDADAAVGEEHLRAAVRESYEQQKDMNHEDELVDFMGDWIGEVQEVRRERGGGAVRVAGSAN
jgi:proteasome-associated ATPase